jgi:inner membrane protein
MDAVATSPVHREIARACGGDSGKRQAPGNGDRWMIDGVSVFAIVVVAFIVITVLMGVRQVPQGLNYGSLYAGPGPLPQTRAHALIGSGFFLEEAIAHGYGRIRVGDSSWRVKGDDCPAGAKVRVVAVEDGSILRVERI